MSRSASASTTCYIIAYDIPDNRRRTKIHKVLSGFGAWTQFSLFECFLTKSQLVMLKAKLAHHIDANRDSLRFYPLCAACVAKVETVGSPAPREEVTFIT